MQEGKDMSEAVVSTTTKRQWLDQNVLLVLVALLVGLIGARLLTISKASSLVPSAPISAMALDSGQQNYLGDTSKYKYVILEDSMYASVPAIKSANPGTKVLVYKNVAATRNDCQYDSHRSSGVSYCYAKTNHPEWFIKDSAGNPFAFCDYSLLYWMDVGNSAYQQQWLSDVVSNAKADGFDGVFMDDTNTHPGHCKDNGGLVSALPSYTDMAYGEAMKAFIANVGPGLKANGLLAMPNISADPWTSWQEDDALAMVPNISVFFREHFMHWTPDNPSVFKDNEWAAVEKQMEDVGRTGDYLANTYSDNSTQNENTMVYARASFLLAWNGSSASAFQYHVDCQCDSYNPIWAQDIGTPSSARYQVGPAWRREFSGGTAIVNPSSSQSVTASLGGSYTDAKGSTVSSVTLAPASAVILKKAVSTDTTPPQVSLTAPTSGATLSSKVQASASVNDNVGVTRIDFYVDSTLKQTGSSNTYSWDTTSADNGSHSLQAKAYDAAGNVGSSTAVTVNVDNPVSPPTADTVAPTVTISSPANGAKVSGNVNISAQADDNVAATYIEVDIDGKLYASAQSNTLSVSWNTRSKKVRSGSHTIKVIAHDDAGNTGSSSITVTK
ncbi:MAG TPA: putative glycoside hydrolase [Candidatus Saccharimonadales bacterium]|nr:putative glycoside hydrolase [Candidatus Saccharimonadales bacterium]